MEASMTAREQQALNLLAEQQPAAAVALARQMNIGKDTLLRYLFSLQEMGLVEKIGSGGHVRWVTRDASQTTRQRLLPYEQAASVWEYARRCQ